MRGKTQFGNVVSSHSSACGRSSLTTKLWIDSRSCWCSSVKMKCLRDPAWSGFRTSVAAMWEPYLAPSLVVPRLMFAVILSLLALVAVAAAQDSPTTTLQHDESRDGTAREVRSGRYAGDPPGTTDPIAARPVDTYETFPVDVPEGSRHSRL